MELSCWRFEALKSRCTIIHREQLLEENGIEFEEKPLAAVEMARRLDAKPDTRPTMEPKPSRRIDTVRTDRKPLLADLPLPVAVVVCKPEPNASMCDTVDENKENVPTSPTMFKFEAKDVNDDSFSSTGSILTPNMSVKSEKLYEMSPETESLAFNPSSVRSEYKQEAATIRVVTDLANVDANGKNLSPNLLLGQQSTIGMSAILSNNEFGETSRSNQWPNVFTGQSTANSNAPLQPDNKSDVKTEATTFKSVPTIRRIIVKSKIPTLYPN